MAETADKVYKVKSDNTADTTPNSVAVVNDGVGDRQIVVLGSGDGTDNIQDGSSAKPLNITTPAGEVALESGGNLAAMLAALLPSLTIDSENHTFKDDFSGNALNPANWTVTQAPGTTTSYSVANSLLSIDADVTANDYIAFTSVQGFTLPFRAQFIINASQRIANNNLYLELVNAAGTQAVALGSLTAEPGVTQVAYLVNGTGVTTGNIVAQNQGTKATADTAATIVTTASYGVLDMGCTTDAVVFGTRTTDNTGVTANSAGRSRTVLDPGETYYLQIRSLNGGSAPASPTTFNIEMVMLRDTTSTVVEVLGGQGDGNTLRGIPISALPILGTVSTVTNANSGFPSSTTDQASGAITTTTTSSSITPTFGTSYQIDIPVTAKSGTNPTLDIVVQESPDSGTNWINIYQFPRITTTGSYVSPVILASGNRVRYVQTVAGTTPSFTRAINRVQLSSDGNLLRQLIDHGETININSLNSTTASLENRMNNLNVQLVVNVGAITTTAPQFQIEGSDDAGTTWYNIGLPLTAVASSTVSLTENNLTAQFYRVIVSTAGSGATAGYVLLRAF